MADTFTPRGAPVPANSYDGWEMTHRPAMLPFLAEYTNPQGETAGGWAMPEMVTEPVNALSRLLNTPAGTMPDPRDQQNQSDALTGLMALYGGNALGGVARNAMSRGVAMGRPNMEAARPVAYSNAIEGAMSNPSLLRMMDDIDYAGLNRRALDEYGVGYEGLNSSQEAALRGWSDPNALADAGRMGVMDYGKAAYLTARHPFEKTTADLSDPMAVWDQFHFSPKEGGDLKNFNYWADSDGTIFTKYPVHGEDTFASRSGPNRLGNDRGVPGDVEAYRSRPAMFDVIDGGVDPSTFLSDTGRPSLLGAALMSGAQGNPVLAQSGEQSPGDYLKDQHQNREPYQQDYQSVPPAGYDQWERQQIDDLIKANPGMKKWDARERLYKSPEFRKKQQDFLKGSKHIPFDEIPPGDFIPHR